MTNDYNSSDTGSIVGAYIGAGIYVAVASFIAAVLVALANGAAWSMVVGIGVLVSAFFVMAGILKERRHAHWKERERVKQETLRVKAEALRLTEPKPAAPLLDLPRNADVIHDPVMLPSIQPTQKLMIDGRGVEWDKETVNRAAAKIYNTLYHKRVDPTQTNIKEQISSLQSTSLISAAMQELKALGWAESSGAGSAYKWIYSDVITQEQNTPPYSDELTDAPKRNALPIG